MQHLEHVPPLQRDTDAARVGQQVGVGTGVEEKDSSVRRDGLEGEWTVVRDALHVDADGAAGREDTVGCGDALLTRRHQAEARQEI